MLPPRIAEHCLCDIVSDELDQVLDAVHEDAVRHEARALLLREDEQHSYAQSACNEEPERIDRQAERRIADNRSRIERIYELAHRIRDFGKGFAHDDYFPSLTHIMLSLKRGRSVWLRLPMQTGTRLLLIPQTSGHLSVSARTP